MPISEKPRKPYNPRKNLVSTKGAWDQINDMVQNARAAMALVGQSSRLVVERKKLGGNFDEVHATTVLSVLLKDTQEMMAELNSVEAVIAGRTGDIREDDEEALMLTLQLGSRMSTWSERWTVVIQPQLDEINRIVSVE